MDTNHTKVIKHLILGNGIAANRNVDAGETLISISEPLLIVVEKEALQTVCSYCLSETKISSLKRCTSCKVARYCTVRCQKSDWKAIHQKECSTLKKLPGIPPTPVRGLIQLLLRYQQGSAPESYWSGLESHIAKLSKSKRWDDLVLQVKAAVVYAKIPSEKSEMALNLLCLMVTNAFRATLADDSPIGLCFEPALALANHSCSPNAVIMFDGRHVSLRTLNPIKAGEQVFISYIDASQGQNSRTSELQERYFFLCECDKCKGDETPYHVSFNHLSNTEQKVELLFDSKNLKAQAEKCIVKCTPELRFTISELEPDIQILLESCKTTPDPANRLALLKKTVALLHTLHKQQLYALPPYPSVLHEFYHHYLETDYYFPALLTLLFISFNCSPYNYPQSHHPIRVLHLFTAAKLLKHIATLPSTDLVSSLPASFGEEFRHLNQNVDYVSVVQVLLILVHEQAVLSHGRESRFIKEVEEEIRDVEEVQQSRGQAGMELGRWMLQGDVAIQGKLLAEKLFADLKSLASAAKIFVDEFTG